MPGVLKLLRSQEIEARFGIKHSKRCELVAAGLLPQPIRLSATDAKWPEHEVDAVIAGRISGLNDEAIKALVVELHGERAGLLAQVRKAA